MPPSSRAQAKVPKHLWREEPPRELVEEILRACGLRGTDDLRQFSKETVAAGVATAEDWLPLLEPYYLPCKAARFFGPDAGPFDTTRLITVLRHILRPHGYDLTVQEKTSEGVKQTLYQIHSCRAYDISGISWEVHFD